MEARRTANPQYIGTQLSDLLSIVIVQGGNGYEATLRHANPKDDRIIRHRFREVVFKLIDQRLEREAA